MRVSALDVQLIELPLHEPFAASHGETSRRSIVVVRAETDIGHGWGECSALPAATYTSESAADSFRAIGNELGHRLLDTELSAGMVGPLLAGFGNRPMAIACLEMAVIDATLRAEGRSLADFLGVDADVVEAGVSVGLGPISSTVSKARQLASEGYRRLKFKIQPGHDIELVRAIRIALGDIDLQVDANGAYRASDLEHVLAVVAAGADAIEQPFAPADTDTAAELVARLGPPSAVPVIADEAVQSLDDAVALLAAGAMSGLSIKPARVGGLLNAVALHDLCRASGLPATAGGMLETGLGRHGLAALAGLPGFTIVGDVSPAGRWLAADPWPDLVMADGRITVPTGPGVAPDPDEDVLARSRVDRRLVVAR